ncbi:MAG: PD-(D/E)XK nuclease family protein [Thermodesulforhabdaceae bacterium]
MRIVRFIPPERVFLKSLADAYLSEIGEKGLEGLWDTRQEFIFIFPSRRAGLYFRYYLGCENTNIVLPRIYALEDLIDELATWHDPKPRISFFDQIWELYQVVRKKLKVIPQTESFERFIPWGVRLVSAFEEVEREGVELPESVVTPDGHPILQEMPLGAIWKAWKERISGMGKVTLGMLYRICIEKWQDGNLPEFIQKANVNFAGFIRFGTAEKAFLKALKGDVTSWIEANPADVPDGTKKILKELMFSFHEPEEPIDSNNKLPEICFYEVPDRHHALEKITDLIETSVDSRPDKIAVIVPDDGILLPLIYELQGIQSPIDVNVTMGYPLRRSLAASFVLSWLELLMSRTDDGRFHMPSFIHLLRHPYTKMLVSRKTSSEASRSGLSSIESLLQDAGSAYMSFDEIENLLKNTPEDDQAAFDIFVIIRELFASDLLSRSPLTIRDVFEVTAKALEEISSPGELLENDPGKFGGYKVLLEQSFCREFIEEIIKPVEKSSWSSEPIENISTAYRLLKETVNVIRIPFSGSPLRGLQVLGFIESNLLSFDEVFILDANEGILPPRRSFNPVLPELLKKQVGLSTAEVESFLHRHLFMRLIRAAKKVHIFYTAMSSSQRSVSRSPLESGAIRSRFVEELIWKFNKQKNSLDESVIPIPVVIPQRVLKRPDRIEKNNSFDKRIKELLGAKLSASFFNTYLKCPVMFFYSYALGIKGYSGEIEEGLEGRGYAELGIIIHKTLEQYFSNIMKARDENGIKINPGEIVEIFSNAFRDSSLSKRLGQERRFFIRETSVYRLTKYLEWLRDEWQPFNVIKLEQEFSCKKDTNLSGIASVSLEGRIDMIALRNNDELWIVDYKTGSPPEPKFSRDDLRNFVESEIDLSYSEKLVQAREYIEDIQLPFYGFLIKQSGFIEEIQREIKAVKACYHALGAGKSDDYQIEMKENILEISQVFDDFLGFLLDHIVNSEAFFATNDLDTCNRCDYAKICSCSLV